MISIKKKFSCVGFNVILAYDDSLLCYTVSVTYSQSGGTFFIRDYKTKGSATRAYNSWVSRLSAVDTRFSNVK